MITLERGRKLNTESAPPRFQGILNGVEVEGLSLTYLGAGSKPRVSAYTPEARARLLECRLGELGSLIESTGALLSLTEGDDREGDLGLGVGKDRSVQLIGFFVLVWWDRSYTYEEYTEALEAELRELGWEAHSDKHALGLSHGTHWRLSLSNSHAHLDRVLGDLFDDLAVDLHTSIETVEAALRRRISQAAVIETFDFPEHLRGPCTQYLLYFVQFLRDLGIEAKAEVKEEAHRVLFSVTPADGKDALQKVRDALAAYLVVPSIGDLSPAVAANPDIAMLQLQANVSFLQSQVQLAAAVVQAKDATIHSLSFMLDQYRQSLPAGSAKAIGSGRKQGGDDTLPVADGLVVIKDYEANGVTVKLPEIFRRLHRRLLGGGR